MRKPVSSFATPPPPLEGGFANPLAMERLELGVPTGTSPLWLSFKLKLDALLFYDLLCFPLPSMGKIPPLFARQPSFSLTDEQKILFFLSPT